MSAVVARMVSQDWDHGMALENTVMNVQIT